MEMKRNHPLKKLHTFGIDVNAREFIMLKNDKDLADLFRDEFFQSRQLLILNGGSNVLFTKDFDGVVIKINTKGIDKVAEDNNFVYVKAKAGEVWHDFVEYCIGNNWGGLENLSLIPGNVGAAPMQNIGAYGVEQQQNFYSLEAMDRKTGEIFTFDAEDCKFGYRESVFKNIYRDKFIILSVTYRLTKNHTLNISYGAIRDELNKMGITSPAIRDVSNAVCNIRRSKLPDPEVLGNAGSFFKNPSVDGPKLEQLRSQFPEIVAFPNSDGTYKIAAGWMIDQLGWKGIRRGDAGVCETQALVLVNHGNAKGSEILALADDIIRSVEKTFGIRLEPEVNIF